MGKFKELETLICEAMQLGLRNGINKNFRERKILKDIIESRDQSNLITYTYLENMNPVEVKGKTALGGKLIYLGQSIGYPIPYSTQYTNPQKIADQGCNYGYAILPQADPNGLFSPTSAEGSWVLLSGPNGRVSPVYCEPRCVCLTFKLQFD